MEKTKWKSFVNGQGDEYIASMATLEAIYGDKLFSSSVIQPLCKFCSYFITNDQTMYQWMKQVILVYSCRLNTSKLTITYTY